MFADYFVGVNYSKEHLQKLIDAVYSYCSKWRLKANVTKSAFVKGNWKWEEHHLSIVNDYTYLGVGLHLMGTWDWHMKCWTVEGSRLISFIVLSVIGIINVSACRLL